METGMNLTWLNAQKGDTKQITALVQKTILEVYPDYYPKAVTDFFCLLHNRNRIEADIEGGYVWILLCDGRLVGTGSRRDNHITRLYVPKNEQGKGFGSYMLKELENQIQKNFGRAELDASLPAEHFYENRGYRTIRQETISEGEAAFSYRVMAKAFTGFGR